MPTMASAMATYGSGWLGTKSVACWGSDGSPVVLVGDEVVAAVEEELDLYGVGCDSGSGSAGGFDAHVGFSLGRRNAKSRHCGGSGVGGGACATALMVLVIALLLAWESRGRSRALRACDLAYRWAGAVRARY